MSSDSLGNDAIQGIETNDKKSVSEEIKGTYYAQSPEHAPSFTPQTEEPYQGTYPDLLPEAGGVAWIDLYGQRIIEVEGKQLRKVFKISLTCRAQTPIAALDGLKEAIDHAEAKYKLVPHSL